MVLSLLKKKAGEDRPSLLDRYGAALSDALAKRDTALTPLRSREIQRFDALMRRIVESNVDGILTLFSDGSLAQANDAALRILGYTAEELQTQTADDYMPGFRSLTDPASEDYAIGAGYRETIVVNAEGTAVSVETCISDLKIRKDNLRVIVLRDVTESKQRRRELEHQALHDPLTGLPNRALLYDRLRLALKTAERADEPMALLLIDLDDFKEVNDTLGHHVGDLLLVEIAQRLQAPLRDSDTVARLGGDEFAILLPIATDMERALGVAERLRQSILQPVALRDGLSAFVGASIGVALYPENAPDAVSLMQCADVAMYCAKDGPEKVVIYDQEKDTNNLRSLALSTSLKTAIDAKRVTLVFQPKLCLRTGRITGVEALARWNDPKLGIVEPDEFIAHAERTGQILALTTMLMEKAIAQIAQWRAVGQDVSIAINMSRRTLHDQLLTKHVRDLLQTYDVPGHLITLEITEQSILADPDKAQLVLKELTELGVRFSIDDFGTGYSSLAALQKMPVQELKIDQSFVKYMLSQKSSDVIVKSTVNLAHNLGMSVVAEGAETDKHIQHLQAMKCDYAQGYGVSRALHGDEILGWIADFEAPILAAE
ncbi:MAG: EAL domain-containing protein [Pseudomonadota bacterium]